MKHANILILIFLVFTPGSSLGQEIKSDISASMLNPNSDSSGTGEMRSLTPKEIKHLKKQTKRKASEVYKEAVELYKAKRYFEAQERLNDLQKVMMNSYIDPSDQNKFNKKRIKLSQRIEKVESKLAKKSTKKQRKLAIKDEIKPPPVKTAKVKPVKSKRAKQKLMIKTDEVVPVLDDVDPDELFNKKETLRQEQALFRQAEEKAREERRIFNDRKDELEKKRSELSKDFRSGMDALYDRGVRLYRKKAYLQAREIFLEVEQLEPNYKSTESYLTRIEDDLAARKEQIRYQRKERKDEYRSRNDIILETLKRYERR